MAQTAKITELVNPKESALRIILGKRKYDSLARKAKAKSMPPYAYWATFVAEKDENGGYIV